MCKVALFNRSFYENNPEFVSRLLHSLVKECGGDGCIHTNFVPLKSSPRNLFWGALNNLL